MHEAGDANGLRIALLTHSVNPRGGVVHTLELAHALHRAGHHVTVFVPAAHGERLFRPTAHRVELVRVPAATQDVPAMVEARIAALVEHLAPLHFDIWHTQDSIGGNALATLVERGLIDGFVRTVHHLDPFTDPRLAAWQQRAFTAARQVLCVSELWRETLHREHGIAAHRVDNGVNLERFTPRPDTNDAQVVARLGLRPGAPCVLAVGGIEARKNTPRLLQAFIALRERHPHAQLVIAGGASLLDHDEAVRSFNATVDAAGLARNADDVIVTGPLPDAQMPALFRAANVLAMPSLREGFGLVVLEALASGTPVVASRIAPFTEHLGDDDVCWCDPLDSASIADALQAALAPERAALLARGTPAVCRRFDWSASAARHVDLYASLLPSTA